MFMQAQRLQRCVGVGDVAQPEAALGKRLDLHLPDPGWPVREQADERFFDPRGRWLRLGCRVGNVMSCIEGHHLIQDDAVHAGVGPDRSRVVQLTTAEGVRVLPKSTALTQRRAGLLQDAEQHGNVLIAVQTIGDEKRHHDDVRCLGELIPLGH